MHSALITTAKPSVRLSVRPSVTRWHCECLNDGNKNHVSLPSDSAETLVLNELSCIQERKHHIRPLLLITNRKSMTLSLYDLEPRWTLFVDIWSFSKPIAPSWLPLNIYYQQQKCCPGNLVFGDSACSLWEIHVIAGITDTVGVKWTLSMAALWALDDSGASCLLYWNVKNLCSFSIFCAGV